MRALTLVHEESAEQNSFETWIAPENYQKNSNIRLFLNVSSFISQ